MSYFDARKIWQYVTCEILDRNDLKINRKNFSIQALVFG